MKQRYRYVDLQAPTPDNDVRDFWLHLTALARRHDVAAFDGFDVGNVDGSPLSE